MANEIQHCKEGGGGGGGEGEISEPSQHVCLWLSVWRDTRGANFKS